MTMTLGRENTDREPETNDNTGGGRK
jgi:hypothetical protein